ncbi:MAG: hypothetical protein RIC07_27490 [Coleofasciculus sp. E1-EBD-02]
MSFVLRPAYPVIAVLRQVRTFFTVPCSLLDAIARFSGILITMEKCACL